MNKLSSSAGLALQLLFSLSCFAQLPVDVITAPHQDPLCVAYEPFPKAACTQLLSATVASIINGSFNTSALAGQLNTELRKPGFLNSAVLKAFGDEVPLGLEFKMLDAENGESVLGLSYALDYQFVDGDIEANGNWNKNYAVDFVATGTITEHKQENPRNFLDTKFVVAGSLSSRIPPRNPDFQRELTEALTERAQQCNTNTESVECESANELMVTLLDSTLQFMRSFQYYDFGIDLGYESDQSFTATANKVSVFIYGQYESWGKRSMLGALNITPAVRLAVDRMNPDSETPRALAGDDSGYSRFSGEISLWMPLHGLSDEPLALTFNYRHYKELNASGLVKAAGLASYDLRTISLTAANGLVASYSSGKLPFEIESEKVVELGWKTYF